jgi:hypothetical protein
MEAAGSFKTLVVIYQTALHHIPEDSNVTSIPASQRTHRISMMQSQLMLFREKVTTYSGKT